MGKIVSNIEEGLTQILLQELNEVGRDTTALNDADKVLVAYFNTCLLFPKPYKYYIHIHNDFICPSEYTDGYEILKKKIQSGEKFSAHLSRTTKDTEKHDLMLYDWGIYHFHLGTTIDDDGYIKRTSKLLYAYINRNDIYFLGIFEHGKWSDLQLIETIHKHYPWSIKGWILDGKPEKIITPNERKSLRDAHINTIITLSDGTSYIGPGWGITAAGTSARVRLQVNDIHHEIIDFEKEILSKLPDAEEYLWKVERDYNDIVLMNNKNNRIVLYNWIPLKNRIEQRIVL